MSDRDEISDLVHRYSDAVTRKDRAQWAATWAEDAWWDLGKGRLTRGRNNIVEFWQNAVDGLNIVVQMVHNGAVKVDGDTASGRWYVSEHVQRKVGKGSWVSHGVLLAWYDDTYCRVDGQWLFASRSLGSLYHGPPDLSGSFTPLS
jgi:ketosteroid isomerase-like protein